MAQAAWRRFKDRHPDDQQRLRAQNNKAAALSQAGRDTDAEPLQLDLKRCGEVLDSSIFSRLRAVDDGLTSGTVIG